MALDRRGVDYQARSRSGARIASARGTLFPRIAHYKTVTAFRERLAELGITLPVDERVLSAAEDSPLAAPIAVGDRVIGNRWCVHPMEGWDGALDGAPSELTRRRWRRFGESGAKLIWGGEAAAVRHDGRANPRQLMATASHRAALAGLVDLLRSAHRERFVSDDDLLVGLQLTHSGRFSRPNGARLEPRIAYHHPLLDQRTGIDERDDSQVWTDDALAELIDDYAAAARTAQEAGFDFVDIKACHGYLLHEFLSARRRGGRYGGDFDGRTRLLLEIVAAVRETAPRLLIGVRLSVFDTPPFARVGDHGESAALDGLLPYELAFGADANDPLLPDLSEPMRLARALCVGGVDLFNITCGSPYYNPHLQRPAAFPPSDGYPPPFDPLLAVWRHIDATREMKRALPNSVVVGSGYTYLQDWLPHVAQAVIRAGWVDVVGIGRMALSYPELPADSLAGREPRRSQVCRTFSDCTTAPRSGLISGCYPLDEFYKELPEAAQLRRVKSEAKRER
ncbi:MAG: NADH:flavin oxidoreductase [Pirellulales bacterium]|nr:NADH:flavin oxidoreductase [Pirellulales bacterium]